MRKWVGVFTSCTMTGAFLVLSSEVREADGGKTELIGRIDQFALRSLVALRNPSINDTAINLTALGSGAVLAILIGFFCLYFFFQKRPILIVHLLSASIGGAALTWFLKSYFERSRPDAALRLVDVQGFSYPSGHSLGSGAVYFSIAMILCKSIELRWAKAATFSAFIALILLIGSTRIYLGVHYFSDVTAGILLGVAWASFVGFASDFRGLSRNDEARSPSSR